MDKRTKRMVEAMQEAAQDGDLETYDKLWKGVTWLWSLGIVSDKMHSAMIREDHRMYETGGLGRLCVSSYKDDLEYYFSLMDLE